MWRAVNVLGEARVSSNVIRILRFLCTKSTFFACCWFKWYFISVSSRDDAVVGLTPFDHISISYYSSAKLKIYSLY